VPTFEPVPVNLPVHSPTQAPATVTGQPGADSGNYYRRSYAWSFGGYEYTWNLTISKSSYDFYKSRPHDQHEHYEIYAMSDYDRTYLDSLVDKLRGAAERNGFSEYESVMMVIAFVQSLPYTYDNVSTGYDEYPRYPIETLVDNGGDCEDTSILTAALLHEMGYDVVLLHPPGHMAVGVKGGEGVYGTYFEYGGSKYYYLETTGRGWDIGELPPAYKGEKAKIYTLQQRADIGVSFKSTLNSYDRNYAYYKVHCDLSNDGTGIAGNVEVYMAALALSQGEDMVWMPTQNVTVGDIDEGGTGWAEATLRIPRGERTKIECIVSGNNFPSEIAVSDEFST
jgi:hypothetical protein